MCYSFLKQNSLNRIYQYGVKQANDLRMINNRTDFLNYSEKVTTKDSLCIRNKYSALFFQAERYLTHLNHGIDPPLSDEGLYGSMDLSCEQIQQITIRINIDLVNPVITTALSRQFKTFEQPVFTC